MEQPKQCYCSVCTTHERTIVGHLRSFSFFIYVSAQSWAGRGSNEDLYFLGSNEENPHKRFPLPTSLRRKLAEDKKYPKMTICSALTYHIVFFSSGGVHLSPDGGGVPVSPLSFGAKSWSFYKVPCHEIPML